MEGVVYLIPRMAANVKSPTATGEKPSYPYLNDSCSLVFIRGFF